MSAADDTSVLTYKRTEATATKTLGDILNRSCAARAALRDMLKVGGADVGPLARVDTEVEGEDKTRPDLVAYDEAGSKRVLVEAKFSADVADNQPAEYLRWLPENDNWYVLLFVAPECRLETLWPEICDMAKRGRFTLDGISETGRLRVAAVAGGNRLLMLTSWRLLLEKMDSAPGVDPSTAQNIRQLNEWCEQEDSPAFLPLRAPELGPDCPRRMLNFQCLVDDATTRLVRKGRAKTEGLGVASRTTGYGRYVHVGSKKSGAWACARLCVDYELWAKAGKDPIWIQFDNDTNTVSLNEIRKRLGNLNDGVLPLPLRTGVEYEEVLDDLVTKLCDLADRVAPAAESS